MMKRLIRRSLLLTTILSLTSQVQGAALPEGLRAPNSSPYPSVRNLNAPSVAIQPQGVMPSQELRIPMETLKKNIKDLSDAELLSVLQYEFEKNRHALRPEYSAESRDVVVFLGNTGAGKSTSINWLAGKRLKKDEGEVGYLLAEENDPDALIIGGNADSTTLYPGCLDVNGTLYFDLPGFGDTDGTLREFVNAAFIHNIFKVANTVRPVFVLNQSNFVTDKAKVAISFFEKIDGLFTDAEADQREAFYASSILLVTDTNSSSVDILWKTLNSKTLSDKGNAQANRLNALLEVWNGDKRIVKMSSPIKIEGLDTDRAVVNQTIQALQGVVANNVNIASIFTQKAENDVLHMYSKMFEHAYAKKKAASKTTFTEYERAIQEWSQDGFWQAFEEGYLNDEYPSISVLKEFTITPYRSAWDEFAQKQNADRAKHIDSLKQQKRDREDYIKQDTINRAAREVNAYKAERGMMDVVPFDFANHVEYQQRVCGSEVLDRITQDKAEHEIAIRVFIDWIRPYYQNQLDQQVRKRFQGQLEAAEQRRIADIETLKKVLRDMAGAISQLERRVEHLETMQRR